MPKMPEEKRLRYEEFNKNYDMAASYPEFAGKFFKRAGESQVNMISMQNTAWMGFYRSPFSHDFANSDIVICGAGTDYGTLSETADMRHAPLYLRAGSKKLIPVIGDEYQTIARAFINNDLIYANIVEYAPGRDPVGIAAANATHLGFEFLCMLTQTKVKLNGGEHKQTEWPHALGTSVSYLS